MTTLGTQMVRAGVLHAGLVGLVCAQGFGLPQATTVDLVVEQAQIAGHSVRIHQFSSPVSALEVRRSVLAFWRAQPGAVVHQPETNLTSPWDLISVQQGQKMVTIQLQNAAPAQARGLISVWEKTAVARHCQALQWPAGFSSGRCIAQAQGRSRVLTEHLRCAMPMQQAWDTLTQALKAQGFTPAPGQWEPVGSLRHLRWTKGAHEVQITANVTEQGCAALVISREQG